MPNRKSGNPEITEYDGVYVDSVNGDTAANGATGTPENPVDNLTDALAIAGARKVRALQIRYDAAIADIDNVKEYSFHGRGYNLDDLDIGKGGSTNGVAAFWNLYIYTTQPVVTNVLYSEFHNCLMIGPFAFDGATFDRCLLEDVISFSGKALLRDCSSDEYAPLATLSLAAGGVMTGLKGQFKITDVAANVVDIYGSGLSLTIDATCTGGTINIYGDVKIINNSGGTVVNDYTNKPQAEVAVNITAINASETDFLNLATAGFHYTIDDLILKCADPGANTVNVKLYKLVNGALVNTRTFAIATAGALVRGVSCGFANYLSMDDMFTVQELAGDNIQVTVRATAGGPYAVTGSYAHRSA